MTKNCLEDQDCFLPRSVTVGAWCNKETAQCERCPDQCFPDGVYYGKHRELAYYPIGSVPTNSDDEGAVCPSPCCNFGMNGVEYDHDRDGYYDFPGRIRVLPCRSEWKDIKMMVLEGVSPDALPEDFVVNGTNCDNNPLIDMNHASGNVFYELNCRFIDYCTTADFSVALLGTDQEDNLRFVNESVYPVTGTFTTGRCSKACETDQDCIEDARGIKEGSWCGVSRCARCPSNCLPSLQSGLSQSLPLGAGFEDGGDCPSPRCCDFGMDGNEVRRNYGEYEMFFNVLQCDPPFWKDIGVHILKGEKLDATPDEFVKNGHTCQATEPGHQEYLHPSEVEIYCYNFMKSCQVQTHTVAMIGTDPEGNLRFVNETAYPISRRFDSHYDSCAVDDALKMIGVVVGVCVLSVCCLTWLCCRSIRQSRAQNNGRPAAPVAETSDDKETTAAEDTANIPSRPEESPSSNHFESDLSA